MNALQLPRRAAKIAGLASLVVSVLMTGWAIAALAAQATPAATAIAESVIELGGLVERPGRLAIDDLRRMPNQSVEVSFRTVDGQEERHTFTGVRLYELLQHVGVVPEPGDRTPLLRRYLTVGASDGYRIVLSGGEIDPQFGSAPILLAWEQDGRPLTGEQAPPELVVPSDTLASRKVWGVAQIEVLGVESAPEDGPATA